MLRKRVVSMMLPIAAVLVVAACQQNAEPVGWAAPNTAAPRPVDAAGTATPTATPASTPTATATARPTPASRKKTKPTRRPAVGIDARTACTAVRTPLVGAVAGLLALRVIAGRPDSTESELRQAQTEAIDRLARLEGAAGDASSAAKDHALQVDLGALDRAAARLGGRIRGVRKPDPQRLGAVAADTGELESATNKLEPVCGRYWS